MEKVEQDAKVLLVGLPDTGKSTFAAAFWGVVNSDQIDGALSLINYSGDDEYLNQIHDDWSKGKMLVRTQRKNEGLGIMELCDRSDGNRAFGKVIIPDLAGERFKTQWEDRVISKDHEKHLKSVNSILFFVHAKKINEGTINDPNMQALDSIAGSFVNVGAVSTKPTAMGKQYTPNTVPTQTKMVDVLQTTLKIGTTIRRIGVVVSAWDFVRDGQKNDPDPQQWLKDRLPLLGQYLESNNNRFEFKVWGISAQGGRLDADQNEIEKLLKKSLKRIIVDDGETVDSDITRPLRWLFANRQADES